MDQLNQDASIPAETPEQRMARLQHLADIKIGEETDAEIVARLVEEARAKRRAETQLPMDTAGFPADYDKVRIFPGTQEHDLSYVALGLNGLVIKAPRDVEIILPHVFVTECLENAVETTVTQTKGGLVLRNRHRFPYQVLGKATKEEYQAFQKEQRAKAERELKAAA